MKNNPSNLGHLAARVLSPIGVAVEGTGNNVADSDNARIERRIFIEVANPPAPGSDAGGD